MRGTVCGLAYSLGSVLAVLPSPILGLWDWALGSLLGAQ